MSSSSRPPITIAHVVIPARDEETRLGSCLESVVRAVAEARALRPSLQASVTVVLDACSDRSADVVDAFTGVRRLTIHRRAVGAARHDGAAGLLGATPGTTWLLSTDADSRVPADWVSSHLEHADRGADLVVGSVDPDPAEVSADVRRRWLHDHPLRDGHGHVHGANLGIRGDTYATLGGFRPLRHDEDVDLVRRALATGAVVARPGQPRVTTSGRLTGRAPHGFAAHLRWLASTSSELQPGRPV